MPDFHLVEEHLLSMNQQFDVKAQIYWIGHQLSHLVWKKNSKHEGKKEFNCILYKQNITQFILNILDGYVRFGNLQLPSHLGEEKAVKFLQRKIGWRHGQLKQSQNKPLKSQHNKKINF